MTKTFNEWFRTFHRWIAVPTALAIPVAVIVKFAGGPELAAILAKLDTIPSILMLVIAISGSSLFLLPYLVQSPRGNKPLRSPVEKE